MTPIRRRVFLRYTLVTVVVGAGASAGLLRPARALAAEWPKGAFAAQSVPDALKNLYGGPAQAAPEGAIKITAPADAENGATVPIVVTTDLPKVEAIAVFVEKNSPPLIAYTEFAGAAPYFAARMKMAESSGVRVVVKSGGRLYQATRAIRVTVGGCS